MYRCTGCRPTPANLSGAEPAMENTHGGGREREGPCSARRGCPRGGSVLLWGSSHLMVRERKVGRENELRAVRQQHTHTLIHAHTRAHTRAHMRTHTPVQKPLSFRHLSTSRFYHFNYISLRVPALSAQFQGLFFLLL